MKLVRIIDFQYTDKAIEDNRSYLEFLQYEVKGFETEVWRIKWKLFEAQMAQEEPDALLLIVK